MPWLEQAELDLLVAERDRFAATSEEVRMSETEQSEPETPAEGQGEGGEEGGEEEGAEEEGA